MYLFIQNRHTPHTSIGGASDGDIAGEPTAEGTSGSVDTPYRCLQSSFNCNEAAGTSRPLLVLLLLVLLPLVRPSPPASLVGALGRGEGDGADMVVTRKTPCRSAESLDQPAGASALALGGLVLIDVVVVM